MLGQNVRLIALDYNETCVLRCVVYRFSFGFVVLQRNAVTRQAAVEMARVTPPRRSLPWNEKLRSELQEK